MQLGTLEKTVMQHLWTQYPKTHFTVRAITSDMNARMKKTYAYNTILTVITHLFEKKLLVRRKVGKTFHYRVKVSKEDFVSRASRAVIAQMQRDYGNLALAHFANALEDVDPTLRAKIKKKTS